VPILGGRGCRTCLSSRAAQGCSSHGAPLLAVTDQNAPDESQGPRGAQHGRVSADCADASTLRMSHARRGRLCGQAREHASGRRFSIRVPEASGSGRVVGVRASFWDRTGSLRSQEACASGYFPQKFAVPHTIVG